MCSREGFAFLSVLLQVKVEEEDEEGSVEEQEEEEEEENWEKALSVERFGDIISDSASTSGDRMGRHYTEKDFECKQSSMYMCKYHARIIPTITQYVSLTNCFVIRCRVLICTIIRHLQAGLLAVSPGV